jgi:ferredoxin-nitrite reductase
MMKEMSMSYKAIWSNNEKLNEVEYIKLEKDGLDVIHTIIEKYCKEGYDSITSDDMNRFKWAGVYEQKPRDGYFMMRVRINSGIMNAQQAEVLAGIAKDFGRGIANVTTRGAIQFHWIQVENIPSIFERLASCGLSSFEACGDCPRTIVGNPLTGVDKDELMDTRDIVEEVNRFFVLNKDFSNLPRKFKISISSSIHNAAHAQINDLAFTPATKEIDGETKVGFHVWVGGGLSAAPMLAQKLNIFVKPEEVLKVAKAACTIFRDYGYRERRTHARLKFLIKDWGADKFQEKLKEYVDVEECGDDKLLDWNASYYYGVHAQKQDKKNYIGVNVPFGEVTAEELLQLASISKEYGDGTIRTTLTQNVILTGISESDISNLLELAIFKRLSPKPNSFLGYTVACTGREFCNLAIVETKDRARKIIEYLNEKIELDTPIRIHLTGCPNSCGQKHIADISLQGAKIKTEEGLMDAFTLWVGGTLNGLGKFSESLDCRIEATKVHLVIEKIILYYNKNKNENELFHEFVNRVGIDEIKDIIK